jgi:hypothetical protein
VSVDEVFTSVIAPSMLDKSTPLFFDSLAGKGFSNRGTGLSPWTVAVRGTWTGDKDVD